MMKIYDKKLAYPYFIWMVLFTVVPLIIVVYYEMCIRDSYNIKAIVSKAARGGSRY